MMMPRWNRSGETITATDEKGNPIVRVPMYEPVYIRPAQDRLYQIRRTNCP